MKVVLLLKLKVVVGCVKLNPELGFQRSRSLLHMLAQVLGHPAFHGSDLFG